MIILMLLAYLACVYAAFKIIKIKVKPFTVGVAVLVGVFILGGIVTTWKLAAPITAQMTLKRVVIQITPDVREFVSKVHVESNQLVDKGQPLFEISKDRFQNAVDSALASKAAAEATVSGLLASETVAKQAIKKADADMGIAKANIETAKKLQRSFAGAVSKLRIAEAQASYNSAQANSQAARASLRQTQASLAGAKNAVDAADASLHTAEFNLSRTTYRSPVDGRVINFQLREQTPVARWQFTSVGTIMDLSDTIVIGVYPQNMLKYVEAGDTVEIAFRRIPGVIATGTVDAVVKYTGEGLFSASAKLPVAASVGSKGFLLVRIRLDDEALAKSLPLGAAGSTAIYTGFAKPFHLISKVVIRMKSYFFYLPT